VTIFVCSCLCFGPLVGQGIGPAQRRQPSFLSPATSSSSLCHCATRGGAQSDARATFSSTAAIKEGLRVIEEGLWPHALQNYGQLYHAVYQRIAVNRFRP